jgi:hypothetical protein
LFAIINEDTTLAGMRSAIAVETLFGKSFDDIQSIEISVHGAQMVFSAACAADFNEILRKKWRKVH